MVHGRKVVSEACKTFSFQPITAGSSNRIPKGDLSSNVQTIPIVAKTQPHTQMTSTSAARTLYPEPS